MSDKDEPIELIVQSHRVHKNFDLLTFEGYDNVNQVEKFKGGILKVPENQLGSLRRMNFIFMKLLAVRL